jgi:hypothetical protein
MGAINNTPFNIGPADLNLSVTQALPAAGANVTTGILDLQSIAPNGDAWRLGRIGITFPNLPENNAGAGITVSLQAAPPSLVNSPSAPALPVPGVFVTPAVAQTLTVAAVAGNGSAANVYYMTLAFDPATGSPYQFYQFLITTPGGVNTQGEPIQIAFLNA